MQIINNNSGATELIGTMILLMIAVVVFSFVFINVMSNLNPPDDVIVNIMGKMENGYAVFEHQGGESLSLDTKIIFTVGGHDLSPYNLYDDDINIITSHGLNGKNDGLWSIGELLYYIDPSWYPNNTWNPNVNSPEIGAKIIDGDTVHMVLTGVLKDGSQGFGGVWPLDDGNFSEIVTDISGRGNTGYLGRYRGWPVLIDYFMPEWRDESGGSVSNCSLVFDGVNDFVFVEDSWSLDITDNITVEAWFKPLSGNIISQMEFDTSFGYYPSISHIINNTYAVVYRQGPNPNEPLVMKTIEMHDDGTLIQPIMDERTLDTDCYEPKIMHVDGNIVSVAYSDDSEGDLNVITVNVSVDGSISTVIQNSVFDDKCSELSFINIAGNTFAIAYGGGDGGNIITFNISDDGVIESVIDTVKFDNKCDDPDIIHLNDNLYVVAYVDDNIDRISTFYITDIGLITSTGESVVFDNGCDDPDLIKISDDVIAVAYEDDKKEGVLKTYNVEYDGSLLYTTNSIVFEMDECHDPDTIFFLDNIFIVAFEGPNGHIGRFAKIEIESDGDIIGYSIEDYDAQRGCEPDCIRLSEEALVIAYRKKTPHPGGLASIRVYNSVDTPYTRGIYKSGSYGIFANESIVYGLINDQIISGSIMSSNGWNHIVLTYDGRYIRLYCNATLISTPIAYDQPINSTGSPLFFGKRFYGYIDEVAIYNKALTLSEIQNHFNHPEDLWVYWV